MQRVGRRADAARATLCRYDREREGNRRGFGAWARGFGGFDEDDLFSSFNKGGGFKGRRWP